MRRQAQKGYCAQSHVLLPSGQNPGRLILSLTKGVERNRFGRESFPRGAWERVWHV